MKGEIATTWWVWRGDEFTEVECSADLTEAEALQAAGSVSDDDVAFPVDLVVW